MEAEDIAEREDRGAPSEVGLHAESLVPWWARPTVDLGALAVLLLVEIVAAVRAPGWALRWGLMAGALAAMTLVRVACARPSRMRVAFDSRGVWCESEGGRWYWPWARVALVSVNAESVLVRHANGGEVRLPRRSALDVSALLALAPTTVASSRSDAAPASAGLRVLVPWIVLAIVLATIVSYLWRSP